MGNDRRATMPTAQSRRLMATLAILLPLSVLSIRPPTDNRRIAGGVRANHADYPWFATLTQVAQDHGMTCGVSMINPTWGVTACQCIIKDDLSGYYPGTGGQIAYGCDNLREYTCQWRDIKQFVPHPCYTISRDENHDDICLVELTAPAAMSRYAKLSGVHGTLNTPAGTPVTMVGLGRSENGAMGVMRKAGVQTITSEQCSARGADLLNFNNVICTAGTAGEGGCLGDSGSPVLGCYGGEDWVLGVYSVGTELVNSTGNRGCGTPDRYAIYTKMESYASFVQTVLRGAPWTCANCHKQGGSSCTSLLGHTPVLGCDEAPNLCSDECSAHTMGRGGPYAKNSFCQDGGEGSGGTTCKYGTDCTDCGPRPTSTTKATNNPSKVPSRSPTTKATNNPSKVPSRSPTIKATNSRSQASAWALVGAGAGGCLAVMLLGAFVAWKCQLGCFAKEYDVVEELDLSDPA